MIRHDARHLNPRLLASIRLRMVGDLLWRRHMAGHIGDGVQMKIEIRRLNPHEYIATADDGPPGVMGIGHTDEEARADLEDQLERVIRFHEDNEDNMHVALYAMGQNAHSKKLYAYYQARAIGWASR